MRLAAPYMLAVILPWLLLWTFFERRYARRPGLSFSQISFLGTAGGRSGLALRQLLPWLCLAAGTLLWVFAAARPQWERGMIYSPSRGLDIMICLDTSGSMRGDDIAPNRLEAAKDVSMDFVQGRMGDRIGLVVFGGIAVMQCPLTADRAALVHYIKSLRVGMTGVDHTALGDGIAAAAARLSRVQGQGRVIILVTDGRSNAGEIDPYMAARLAAENGIRLYTVGIGAPAGSSSASPQPGTEADELDEACLRELASLTSGQYFRAGDAQTLAEIYRRIDGLEKRLSLRELADYRDLYPWLVLAGAGLVFLGILLHSTCCRELP